MTLKEQVQSFIDKVQPADAQAAEKAREYGMGLAKIPGSLGRIEDIAVQLASITGQVQNEMPKKCVIIMSSDNNIVSQGVSSAPQSVTLALTEIFDKYATGVGIMAMAANADIIVYDVGINGVVRNPNVIDKKVRFGAADFSTGSAMEPDECFAAILIGINAAKDAAAKGYSVIGTGEMGIGNTSSTTCITTALTGVALEINVGKGTGMLTDEDFARKVEVLAKAMEVNKPDASDVFDVMAKVGGLDIAAMVGLYIGAAIEKMPVVIDGYISSVAALCAYKLKAETKDYMIESHASAEPGYLAIKEEMGLRPMFDMNMRLGEGSGCPLAFFAIDCANNMMNKMWTFEQAVIDESYTDNIDNMQFN
ncbi:MAG: nicotinate-nucleotide--dimethylbenzimidazole phosphoribosyltransferase [Eubacteriaceae bacterium]|nr:nicotinate-nucleotide--dimethylbenzimidazole phosphoribosyltransferase [Eubacteriaceae bacterium]